MVCTSRRTEDTFSSMLGGRRERAWLVIKTDLKEFAWPLGEGVGEGKKKEAPGQTEDGEG